MKNSKSPNGIVTAVLETSFSATDI